MFLVFNARNLHVLQKSLEKVFLHCSSVEIFFMYCSRRCCCEFSKNMRVSSISSTVCRSNKRTLRLFGSKSRAKGMWKQQDKQTFFQGLFPPHWKRLAPQPHQYSCCSKIILSVSAPYLTFPYSCWHVPDKQACLSSMVHISIPCIFWGLYC